MRFFLNFDTSKLSEEKVDVLVCGSGIAGLTTAITLRELGLKPVILTRGMGNTYYSQGGIACAVHPQDSPLLHFIDTYKAGRGLCHEMALRVLVDEGIQCISHLERWGVKFDTKDGLYETTLEGGHSFPRVLKVKDYTGRAIYQALLKKAQSLEIPIITGELQEILAYDGVKGVLYYDGSLKFLRVKALVLATGGAASIFLHTSNPVKVRGDAIGIALRCAVDIKNPEFVQFHPTVVEGTNLLISEAVRGEGALLVDDKGERFVNELEPRDTVARAIYNKLKEGKRVFLDMRPIKGGEKYLQERFPTIVEFLEKMGLDPRRDLIPVVPAAHYFIGGMEVDLYGRTQIFGLYAVGECACSGVHGANRLASNSLLEGVVFGHRVAHRIYHDIKYFSFSASHFKSEREAFLKPPYSFDHLRKLMWDACGLEREEGELLQAIEILKSWLKDMEKWEDTIQNRELLDITLVALSTLKASLSRRESRGVHYRRDYPYEREELRRDSLVKLEELLGL
ncbi:L-aspartate oxidase [Hydrogenobacter thermophilus TK-6]|uniref:L-aspartate oxidase n=1 Tax=Hydrogenobacter thermophilus (strain DSM 6534 / IAM 12695 / TK-6) TaxID=608538 RepID=D3DG37_HYDTT|nr:L-aspartate oxidase [Hydrogenobacter thermophilus]ADO44724.1 L-aspartate oxidase [Hydrogenobacter thermophilus TK-6]BAI68789.1 L-aspartate oxidase [Hydrogenobacter thermophilus TK-6]